MLAFLRFRNKQIMTKHFKPNKFRLKDKRCYNKTSNVVFIHEEGRIV